jgi:hypothetical protein
LSIASNIQWYALIPHKAYSFITTLFLGPFDDVITKFYCIQILGVSSETWLRLIWYKFTEVSKERTASIFNRNMRFI